MIVIKGHSVSFRMKDGRILKLPRGFGIIHDPDGKELAYCNIFFGAVKKTKKKVEPDKKATKYLGSNYQQHIANIDIPFGPWSDIGEVVEIFYTRTPGSQYAGKYFHIFKRRSPMLSKCKRTYKLALQDGCIVDDRGFVFP